MTRSLPPSSPKFPPLMQATKPPLIFCAIAIAVGFFVFLIWGNLAPLDSAAIATGQVTLTGHCKTIQHLEGGVVEAIWVKEGDAVKEGDKLITLSPTNVASQLQRILWQLKAAKILEKRLLAQEQETQKPDDLLIDQKETLPLLDFSPSERVDTRENGVTPLEEGSCSDNILQNPDEATKQLMETQQQILQAKCREQHAFISSQYETIKSHKAQLASLEKVLKGEREKLKNFEDLYAKDMIPKFGHGMNGLFEAQRVVIEMETNRTRLKSAIAEANLKIIQFKENLRSQIASEFQENHLRLLEFHQEYRRLKDIVDRTIIKAPVTGIVKGLEVHTIGGVVHPGAKLMDIVPDADELIIEASVNPQDIESIFPGLEVKIQLNAYKARLVPRISGHVLSVSADVLYGPGQGPQSGAAPYYLVRIKVSEESINKLSLPITLTPGMPVTVFIVKGSRTLLQYLLSPIKDSFHKAFKEAHLHKSWGSRTLSGTPEETLA